MDTTLRALQDIGRHLSALPGRKSILWLTAGLSLNLIINLNPDLWHRTLDTLNDGNVAVYAVDSAGVRTIEGYRAENPGPRSGAVRPIRGTGVTTNTHVMFATAESTGGRAYAGSNDLARGIREAIDDSSFLYRIAYRPAAEYKAGEFVPIQVKVNRTGIEVRHRAGYLSRAGGMMAAQPADRLLQDAIVSPLDALELGLRARVLPAGEQGAAVLLLVAEPGSLTLQRQGNRISAAFDFRLVQRSRTGQILEDVTDEVDLALTEEQAKRTESDGFAHQRKLKPVPDASEVKIAVCDRWTGRVGSLVVPLR